MQFYRIRRTNQNNWPAGVVHHGFGQANPIKHARLTLDCDCTFDLNDIMPKTLKTDCESGTCSREFTGEYKALRKVRNSNGQASKVALSNREYLKAKCATYDQKKYHYTIDEESTQKNKYQCKSTLDVSCCTTWKPTNHYYVQDGGVSSSTNTQKKKYNSIQSTAKSMEAAFDHGVMIAHAYSGRPEAPYTQKSKTQPSMCGMFKRTGTKQRC